MSLFINHTYGNARMPQVFLLKICIVSLTPSTLFSARIEYLVINKHDYSYQIPQYLKLANLFSATLSSTLPHATIFLAESSTRQHITLISRNGLVISTFYYYLSFFFARFFEWVIRRIRKRASL